MLAEWDWAEQCNLEHKIIIYTHSQVSNHADRDIINDRSVNYLNGSLMDEKCIGVNSKGI